MESLEVKNELKVNLLEEVNPENRKEINNFINPIWEGCNWKLDDFLKKINIYNKSKEVKQNKNSEIFWICDENGNDLYYPSGMPVLEFRWNCHRKGEIKNVRNFHKWTNRIITDCLWNIFISIKNDKKADTWGGKMEIWGWHTWVNWFYDTLLTELDEELAIKQWEYESPIEINTTILSDTEQNQYNKIYNVTVKNYEFMKRKWDGETWWWKFYSVPEVIEIIKWTRLISHHRAPLLDFLAMKWNISLQEHNSLKQDIEKQDLENNKHIKVVRSISNQLIGNFS